MDTAACGSTARTAGARPAVVLGGVGFSYGSARPVLDDVNLTVPPGRFVSIVGPSGCGKSSLLHLIAGLAAPTTGTVELLGRPVNAQRHEIGYVFQQDVLLPWRTLEQNVALGPQLAGTRRAARLREAREWLARVGLAGFEDSYPHQVSGGMRRRAAIAQTWITGPDVLLMDEPFSAVDVQMRTLLGNALLGLWGESGQTVVFVTHDLEEAVSLSDEVIVLSSGPASTVVGRFPVLLERPRDLLDIRTRPAFREVCDRVWQTLRDEVAATYGEARR
ncbi:ABC transporter ATP-binding protein [Streptoverticillium reticulum]|uniref:ABC transporter ATP-binding protein n=1 Tax=Streptoverticillium reticulum TaxID=1433415 RepID=UPI0039BF67CA